MAKILFNGNIIPSDEPCFKNNDRGLALGHGLFETMLINQKSMPFFHYHWERLNSSARYLQIHLPFTEKELSTLILNLLYENQLETKKVGARLMVTYGESERGLTLQSPSKPNYALSVNELKPFLNNDYSLTISNFRRNELNPITMIKSTSFLENILARNEANQLGFDEAILLNTKGNVAECSTSNIFLVFGNHVLTPPTADGALPGVVRRVLLSELALLFNIEEKSIHPSDINSADEIFVTNSLIAAKRVTKFENNILSSDQVSSQINHILQSYF